MTGDRTPAADPARLTEEQVAVILERCLRGKGYPMDVPDLVAALRASWAENARYRAALAEVSRKLASFRGGDPARTSELALSILDVVDAALAAPGAGENGSEA